MANEAYAEESIFKKTSAYWHRGSKISVHPTEEIRLLFSIIKKDGSAHTDFSGNIKTNIGVQAKLAHIGKGQYEAILPPVSLKTPTSVQIYLKGRSLSKTWKDTWYPKKTGSISVKTTLTTIILSEKKITIPVDIKVTGPLADKAKLRFKASSGKVSNVKNLGKGNYRGEYIPYKKNRAPKNVLISVSDQHNPLERFGATVIPMFSKINLPIDAKPNSNVTLDIAGKKTAAIKTNKKGKAVFDVLVPPNVQIAKLITEGSNPREDEIDLNIPTQRKLVFVPTPRNIPADQPIKIRFFAVDDDGKPDVNNKTTLSVNLGTITKPKHKQNGIYEADYVPSPTSKRAKVTVRGDDKKKTKFSFFVDAMRPEKLILLPKQGILEAEAKTLTLNAQLLGARSAPLSNRKLYIESPSAKLQKINLLSFGQYETKLATELDPIIPLIAHVHDEPSKNPVSGFVVDAKNLRFTPKSAPFTLAIVSHDSFGAPVGKTKYSIKVKKGDATISESKSTNEQGFSYPTITPGEEEGPVILEISTANITTEHLLFQLKETSGPSLSSLQVSGNKFDQKIVQQWRNSISFLSIPREEVLDGPKTKNKTRPKKIEVTHTPSKGRPGGEARLEIQVLDRNNNGIMGANLRAFSSLGKISSIEELGDGMYEAFLNIPNSIQQDIDIEVDVRGSKIQSRLTLPVSKGEARTEKLPVPKIIAKAPPNKKKKSKKNSIIDKSPTTVRVKKPRQPFKWPKFSLPVGSDQGTEPSISIGAGAVLGTYGYQQEPLVSGSALYDSRVAFNNEVQGSSPADSVGISMRLRANTSSFAPQVSPYLLMEARLLSYNYAFTLAEFPEAITDWNTQIDVVAIPRYSFTASNHRGHIGARIGWSLDDVMLFQQQIDQDKVDVSYSPQSLQGPTLGLDLAYSSPVGISIDAFGGIGLMGGIYRREGGLQLAYPLGAIDAQLGVRWNTREVTIEGSSTDLGVITDECMFGYIGVGRGF
jgi:hypothetical protein